MEDFSRRAFLATAGSVAIAGCAGRLGGGASSDATGGTPRSGEPPLADHDLPLPMSPAKLRGETRSGGQPKDGIPSIDDPKFVSVAKGNENLADGDPVFGVYRNDVAKAYPQSILVQHEICNDAIGGERVSVTYCPLTGTAMGFLRGETTFGVSGRLLNNNLVMYDRASEAWWPQVLATSIPGPWNGAPGRHSLREFRVVWTTWKRWKEQYPDTEVLSEDTGFARNYDVDFYGSYNPKGGYYANRDLLFPALSRDDRYHPKRVVMGARTPEGAAAFLKDALRKRQTLEGEIGGEPVTAVYDRRLDTAYVYRNPEGKSIEVRNGKAVLDGTKHLPDELPLDRVLTFDAMWFAWAGFYPDGGVYE